MVELSGPVNGLGKIITTGVITDSIGRVLYHIHANTPEATLEFVNQMGSLRKEDEMPKADDSKEDDACFICTRGVKRYDKILRVADGDTINIYDFSNMKPFTSYTL